jgi:hypothetical protein
VSIYNARNDINKQALLENFLNPANKENVIKRWNSFKRQNDKTEFRADEEQDGAQKSNGIGREYEQKK